MAGKYDHIDFKPPKSVADAAARGLELRQRAKKSHKGGLTTSQAKKEGVGSGVQRAVNLKNRDTMSPETVRRMLRFFMRHAKSAKIDPGKTPLTDKGYQAWCLAGDTMITLADGSQMSIEDICNSSEDIYVLSYNENTGALEPKLVTDKIVNPAQPSDFYRLSLGRGTFRPGNTTKKTNIWITGEHKVFDSNKEWTPVSELANRGIWRLELKPTGDSEQVILGSLLGDASISKSGKLAETHCIAQKQYLDLKMSSTGGKLHCRKDPPGGFNKKTKETVSNNVCLGLYGKELRNKLYKDRKRVSRDYLNSLNAIGLACWFFDDGSLHHSKGSRNRFYYRLHTEGFTHDDVEGIVAFFNENGIKCRSYKRENCEGRVIYFSPSSSRVISALISPYASVDMKYKLWPEHRDTKAIPLKKEYVLAMFSHEQKTQHWDQLGKEVKKANHRRLYKKYDLTVEDNHNFFANGVLVHNCIWGGNPGYAWARKIVRQMDAADEKAKKKKKKARAALIPVFEQIVRTAGVVEEALEGIRPSELVILAGIFDAAGLYSEADALDAILEKVASKTQDQNSDY